MNKYTDARVNYPSIIESSLEEFKKTMDIVSLLIGLKEALEENEIILIFGALRNNKKFTTNREIVLAFELAVSGKLDLKHDDLKHYNQVSVEYVFRILNSYQRLLSSNRGLIQEIKESQAEAKEYSSNDLLKDNLMWMCERFKTQKKLGGVNFADGDNCYLYRDLKKIGFFQYDDNNKGFMFVEHLNAVLKRRYQSYRQNQIKARRNKGLKKKVDDYEKAKEVIKNNDTQSIIDNTNNLGYFNSNFYVKEAVKNIQNEEFNKWIKELEEFDLDIEALVMDKLNEFLKNVK